MTSKSRARPLWHHLPVHASHTRVGARPHAVPFDSLGTPLIPRKPPLENHQRSQADIPVFFPQKGRSRPAAAPQPESDL